MLVAGYRRDIAMNDAQPLAQLKGPIVLAGAGKMGGAMLTGWLARGLDAKQVAVLEPQPSGEIGPLLTKGVRLNPSPKDVGTVATLVIALKPQSFREAGSALKLFAGPATLVVSIMAGTPTASIAEVSGRTGGRAQPHTPAPARPRTTGAVPAEKSHATPPPAPRPPFAPPPATWGQNVTSPGGTPAAALGVLMGPDGLESLMIRAVAAATKRSKELAK